jgi:hypothetical protein
MKFEAYAVATTAADHTIIEPHISHVRFILSETIPAKMLEIISGVSRIGPLSIP